MTTILLAQIAPYENTVEVEFSSPLTINDEVYYASNYLLTNGAYVKEVELINNSKVRLWSEYLYNNASFSISISSNILDVFGFPIIDSYDIYPFQSSAHFSNYNGKIRTSHISEIVKADNQRLYLASTKGIDVLKRINKTISVSKWGQIYNPFGILSMNVASFGNSYTFVDTVAPYLKDLNPAPGGSQSNTDPIYLTIADIDTAVDIHSVIIYINGDLVFNGRYGWGVGFSGNLTEEYKELVFKIYSAFIPTNSTILIQVIAEDLQGNVLNTSYTYSTSIIGFGIIPFGLGIFGGV